MDLAYLVYSRFHLESIPIWLPIPVWESLFQLIFLFGEVYILIPRVLVSASNTKSIYTLHICIFIVILECTEKSQWAFQSWPKSHWTVDDRSQNWAYLFLTPKPVLISQKQKDQTLYQRGWVSHSSNFVNVIAPFPFGLVVLL